jgi:hypothetical protein
MSSEHVDHGGGNPFTLLLIALVVLTLYITGRLMYGGVHQLAYSMQLRRWPVATATLIDSSLQQQIDPRNGHKQYVPRLAYEFKDQNGNTYEGDQLSKDPRRAAGSEKRVTRELQDIRSRQPLYVHYDPANPKDAALDVDVDDGFLSLVFGLGLLLLIVPPIAGGVISNELDRMLGWRAGERTGPLPPAWKRFGIYDDGQSVRFILTRKRWLSAFAAVGLALLVAGMIGLLLEGNVPHGPWRWIMAAVLALVSLLRRLGQAPFRSYLFDGARKEIYECKRSGEKELFAMFNEVGNVELLENPSPRGETRGRTRLELPVNSGEGSTYRLTLDLSTLPAPVVDGLARRLAEFTGKEVLHPDPPAAQPVGAPVEIHEAS